MSKSETPKTKRILLKLSGEALMGDNAFGISRDTLKSIVGEIKEVVDLGVQLAIVVGGGNIFRGVALGSTGMDRATGDYMGMLATCMNAMALQDALRNAGVEARVQCALDIDQVAEPYIRGKALSHLKKGRVVIFAAGTGNPFFTTDTAAALRSAEIGADMVLKATQVDGVFTADPKKDPNAKMYKSLTFDEAIQKKLKILDATAFTLCRDQGMPIRVSPERSNALCLEKTRARSFTFNREKNGYKKLRVCISGSGASFSAGELLFGFFAFGRFFSFFLFEFVFCVDLVAQFITLLFLIFQDCAEHFFNFCHSSNSLSDVLSLSAFSRGAY